MDEYTETSHFENHLIFFKILIFLGIFPSKSTKKSFILIIFVQAYGILLPSAIVIYNAYLVDNLNERLDCVLYLVFFFSVFLKCMNFYYQRENILKLLRQWKKLKEASSKIIITSTEYSIEKIGRKIFIAMCVLGFSSNILRHYLLNKNHLIYTVSIEFDSVWQREMIFWIQISQMLLVFLNFMAIDCILLSNFVIFNAHLKCVAVKLTKISGDVSSAWSQNKLKETLKYHLDLTK